MKKGVAILVFLILGVFTLVPIVDAQHARSQATLSIDVTKLKMEGVGFLYYGEHLASPPDAAGYADLIKLLYGEMGVEIPAVYKIYILPYEVFEEVLAYLNTTNEYDKWEWLYDYIQQQDNIAYAFIDVEARERGEVVIYLFEASYPAIIHENFHYILHSLSTNGWMNRHSIIQPLESSFIASNVFRSWLREYR